MKMKKMRKNEKSKKYRKVHCHYTGKFRGAAHSNFNLKYNVPKNIPIEIHNAGYDTHFTIQKLAEKFKGKLECIGENMEKFITFSASTKTCSDGMAITHKLKFINSFKFMTT